MFRRLLITMACCLFSFYSQAQAIERAILEEVWKAQWITGPGQPINQWSAYSDAGLQQYAVFKFRKTFDLTNKPASFVIHVSADNRYKLFVNGKQVSQGPARNDLYFWNFETVDIASALRSGSNTISAVVWNEGEARPVPQITNMTAFILQGNGESEQIVNTNDSWLTVRDDSYRPLAVRVPGYYVAGPGEFVDMRTHVKGWSEPKFDDSKWSASRLIGPGLPKDAAIDSRGWMLVPSTLPQMEMTPQRLLSTRKAEGVKVPSAFPAAATSFTIPPNTHATILLDQGFNTNAYPTLVMSGGKASSVSVNYAEALYNMPKETVAMSSLSKGNRNEIAGKIFIGRRDSIVSDGSSAQQFTPLTWRTFRYVQLRVHTQGEPLTIEDFYGTFTGYPFVNNSRIDTNDKELQKIIDIGWRTARLCAFETYMDCPYYEQLQYIGDARIQALVSMYNSGDDRLVKSALTQMDHSRIAEGITLSRYPSNLDQQIPTFSLWWIGMVHDYWMYGKDVEVVEAMLPGTREVLSFFKRYQQPDGSLKNVPYWTFTDWVRGIKNPEGDWARGMAPVGSNGESAVLDIQLMWTYQTAADLEEGLGLKELARLYRSKAEQLKETINKKYWDDSRGLYADTESKRVFSQHANALAILADVAPANKQLAIATATFKDTALAPASIYFKFYLHQALVKAGMGDDYLTWLGIWRENIQMGLSTWGETSEVNLTRSDCHAWGSSPNIELYRIVLGIDSDAPGFRKVKIEPHLGNLRNIGGEMPHPAGKIKVLYTEKKGKRTAEITLPEGITGRFIWKGKEHILPSSSSVIEL